MTEQPTPQRPPFQVRGLATVKHLNVRKEGPDDEKILAVDVKLELKKIDRMEVEGKVSAMDRAGSRKLVTA